MRVGIWCAYGKTLEPTDGIGVFVHLLARHLAKSPRVKGVVLAVHQGDTPLVGETMAAGEGRIETVELLPLGWQHRWRRKRLRWRHRRLVRDYERSLGSTHSAKVWGELQRIEAETGGLLAKQLLRRSGQASGLVGGEDCDVWVLPHVSVERTFSSASVVLIHDMVPLREPGLVKAHDLAAFRRRSQAIAERSTLIGCMSQVIRETDIVGLLGAASEKVRVVLPAIPDDIASPQDVDFARSEDHSSIGVSPPYVFYPAAFRPYKNHELLIKTLVELDRRGLTSLKLVFTGDTSLPQNLVDLAAACGMTDRVLATGRVDRHSLVSLYLNALATVVPSRHEQGSFPALEALACGCPVAVSDIPSLREAFGDLGDAMLFFDPTSVQACADSIETVCLDSASVVSTQGAGFERLRRRTWTHATDEWVDVFAEAICIHEQAATE